MMTTRWTDPRSDSSPEATAAPILQARDLRVEFSTSSGTVPAVRGVDLEVRTGERLAIVGESGSGKSVTARSLMRLLPQTATISGAVEFRGQDVLAMDDEQLRAYRGSGVAMVFQDPQSSLNPVLTIGEQVAEAMLVHGASKARARARAAEILEVVGVPDPQRRLDEYPHQFSGGMRQRVGIAMALVNEPDAIIADEPTTALDVTVQAQILDTFERLNSELGTAIVLITHNVGVVARLCDRVVVMYGGRVAETGPVTRLLTQPSHPYTAELLQAVPRLDRDLDQLHVIVGSPPDLRHPPPGCTFAPRCALAEDRCQKPPELTERGPGHAAACWVTEDAAPIQLKALEPSGSPVRVRSSDERRDPVLSVRGARKTFAAPAGRMGRGRSGVRALDDVSIELRRGETVGLVGESGCGKSTLARAALGLLDLDEGEIRVGGVDLLRARGAELRARRREIQMVFQDPYSSLNPRHTIRAVLAEPLRIHSMVPPQEIDNRIAELLDLVGLPVAVADRLPREFSGGQRQRVAIARALATEPSVVVLDEPVSSLDVSLQAQMVHLLSDLQNRLGVAFLFVAHDLALVRAMSDTVAVMYLGQVLEQGPVREVTDHPLHPYTASLLSAVPDPDPRTEAGRERITLTGDVPSPADPPAACPFHTRCPIGPMFRDDREICATTKPALTEHRPGRWTACHFADEAADLVGERGSAGRSPVPSTVEGAR